MAHSSAPKEKRTLIVWKQSLERKHADLDEQLLTESKHPMPDSALIQRLKRSKLKVKDELSRIDGVLRTLAVGRASRPA